MDAFEGVEVWNIDVCSALEKIKREIKDECTVYIDPPYLTARNSDIKTSEGGKERSRSDEPLSIFPEQW